MDADEFVKLTAANKERPPIPPVPDNWKDWRKLSKQKFKTIKKSNPVATRGGGYGTGGESSEALVLECPNCTYQFDAILSYGCFHVEQVPYDCPNCRFPTSMLFNVPKA